MQPLEYFPAQWVVHMSRCCMAAMAIFIQTMEIKHCALLEATLDAMHD